MNCSIGKTGRRNAAGLTLIEVIVVTLIVAVLLAIYLNWYTKAELRSQRIRCVGNLKGLGIAFRGFAIDYATNNAAEPFPMQMSITNGGVLESIAGRNVWPIFQVLSNEINNPRVLHCPADATRRSADSFTNLANQNISYFVGLDSTDTLYNSYLLGDSSLMITGTNLNAGTHVLTTNTPVRWWPRRHGPWGNILFGDGSVQSLGNPRVNEMLAHTGLATNRLLFP